MRFPAKARSKPVAEEHSQPAAEVLPESRRAELEAQAAEAQAEVASLRRALATEVEALQEAASAASRSEELRWREMSEVQQCSATLHDDLAAAAAEMAVWRAECMERREECEALRLAESQRAVAPAEAEEARE